MRLTKLLGFKLFLTVFGVMAAGSMLFALLSIEWHTDQYLQNKVASVGRMSDVLQRSMHYGMLMNRREDVNQIVRTVGTEPGINAVRIYNKKGAIVYSSDSAECGKVADFREKECSACHTSGTAQLVLNPQERTRIFVASQNHRILGMITPIRNETSCSEADCHAHPATQPILGVLDVMVPLDDLDESLSALTRVQYSYAFMLVSLVTGVSGIFIWIMVYKPVRRLIRGTEELSDGNLSHRIRINSTTEIGMLADSFNDMAEELQRARDELTGWTQTLEERVQEKTDELRRAQSHMFQMEKMVSLGTLAATVAHELNNPLEGILTYAKLLKRRIVAGPLTDEGRVEMQEELTTIATETARCGNIVKNLLLFSRQKVGDFSLMDIRSAVEQSLKLVDHHFKMHGITLDLRLGETPVEVVCDPSQIEQALLAIEINAVEAMPDGGTFRLELSQDRQTDSVKILLSDTGIGIRDEDLPHIFEPFYTTKHEGKGTGLGLAVVFGIVERHGGSISVQSTLHQGTVFTIQLPKKVRAAEHRNQSERASG